MSNLRSIHTVANTLSALFPRPTRRRARRNVRMPRLLRRAVSVALVITLLTVQTPAAPPVLKGMASEWKLMAAIWLQTGGLAPRLQALLAGQKPHGRRPQEGQADRDGRVASVQLSPDNVVLRLGEQVKFNAVAYAADGATLGGVRFKWRAQDAESNRKGRISPEGEFEAHRAGTFVVTAEGARRQAQVTVRVLGEDVRRVEGQTTVRKVSTRDLPAASEAKSRPARRTRPREKARRAGEVSFVAASFAPSSAAAAPAPEPAPVRLPNYEWNIDNYPYADDPGNGRGDPPGGPADDGAGSGNFQILAPVLSLPGRGADISLNLTYNSRVWTKTGSDITFDMDRDWPAPGWSLGFGKMIGMNAGGSMIVDADGTRRAFTGEAHVTTSQTSSSTRFEGHTSDGSLIDFSSFSYNGTILYGEARLPNGTVIAYGAPGEGAVYPTQITDANGNYVRIAYRNNAGPHIQTVTDTLNRVINFHYDSNNLLTAITAPGLGGAARTLVRLHYQQLTLNPCFSGLTVGMRNQVVWALDAIYYPGTNTGYWFGDSESYFRPFGMIEQVREQRGMSFSGPEPVPASQGPTGQGTITAGTTTRQSVYNYSEVSTCPADAPSYTSLTDTWEGMETTAAVTTYATQQNATNPLAPGVPSRKVEMELPNGTTSTQYSFNYTHLAANDPLKYRDGLVYQDETRDATGKLLQSSTVEWEKGAYDSARPLYTVMKDERGQVTGNEFTYGTSYNQVIEARNYGYGYTRGGAGNVLLQRTATAYENGLNYTKRHIFNLVTKTETFAADGVTRVALAEYQYDGTPLAAAPGVVNHLASHDPYTDEQVSGTQCCLYEYEDRIRTCAEYCLVSAYQPATNFRGNVTSLTSYADAGAEPAQGAVTQTRTYDITGNLVTASSSCCEQTSFTYTSATQFAYPESQTRGAADPNSPLRLTTNVTYDFSTGLGLTATDSGGRTHETKYNAATLRPHENILPTGARSVYEYDDALLKVTSTTKLAGGAVSAKRVSYLDGLGQVRRGEALAGPEAPNWSDSPLDVVETKYDQMGRVWQQSRPYRKGAEQPQWTETVYDALSRETKVQLLTPDGPEVLLTTQYGDAALPRPAAALPGEPPGELTKVTDGWGRERWGRSDALGQLVEVVEPNPDGDGTVGTGGLLTTYSYDTAGNLTQVQQGAQQRLFRHDSFGRLTHQKLAETTAVFNDAGLYVGPGGAGAVWSDLFAYDSRSNLVSRTDARNVKTTFSFRDEQNNEDPLNRLLRVTYAAQSGGVPEAKGITYEYVPSGEVTRLKRVSVADTNTEDYLYDVEGRVEQTTITLLSRPSRPMVTDFAYDSLGRVTDITYPMQYPSETRKVVHQDYDIAGRMSGLKVGEVDYASAITYNAASYVRSLKVGAPGDKQVTEAFEYDAATGLMTEQRMFRGSDVPASRLLHLSYDYLRPGTTKGRTGRLTKITNHLSPEKGRAFKYDALGRLKQVAGGNPAAAPLWTQTYTYDRYGNREGVTAAGNTAALKAPAEPSVKMPDVQLAAHAQPQWPGFLRAEKGGSVTDAPTGPRLFAPTRAAAAASTAESPSNLAVTSASAEQISLEWAGPAGTYRVERKTRHANAGQYALVSLVTGTAFTDAPPAAAQVTAYRYRVCAAGPDGNCASAYSNAALGTAITFTDPQLTGGATQVKAQHFLQLRQAVDAVRSEAYLTPAAWAENLTQHQTPVRASHVEELRNRLYEALTLLRLPTPVFTDPTLSTGAGGTPIRRAHVEELRQRSTRGAGSVSDGCLPDEQFVVEFYQLALARHPAAGELSYWTGRLKQAAGQGAAARLGVGRELGRALFLSTEYEGRNRSVSEYVSDLYWGYLGRAADPGGLAFWVNEVETYGRPKGVEAFEASIEFEHRVWGTCGPATGPEPVPTDGHSSLSYDPATNRINSPGWEYDAAGNQTRILVGENVWQRLIYDAANRLVKVTNDAGTVTLAQYTYGDSSARLITHEGGSRTYYAWSSSGVIAEYVEADGTPTAASPQWSVGYVYLGGRLLATQQPSGGGERVEYHHPDNLGTRLVTNSVDATYFEQTTLPYGTGLGAESTGATARRFTTYERSQAAGLDYAINRAYDARQGRFTQIDPLEMGGVNLEDPQTLNLYAYCINDPVNYSDPSGLFFGFFKKLFGWIAKAMKWIITAVAVVVAVIGVLAIMGVLAPVVGVAFGIAMLATSGLLLGLAHGPPWLQRAIGAASKFGTFSKGFGPGGTAVFNPSAGTGLGGGGGSINNFIFRWQEEETIDVGEVIRININICANGNKYPHCGAGNWGLLPAVGPAWDAHDAFRSGRWGWGILYSVDAVSDITIVGGLIKGGAKLVIKGGSKLLAKRRNELVKVTRWGRPGLEPEDWVMVGGKTRYNWIMSGKSGFPPGLKWIDKMSDNLPAPYRAGESFMVPRSSLRWPKGPIGKVKGALGQRKYRPR